MPIPLFVLCAKVYSLMREIGTFSIGIKIWDTQ
jgi:hypothetical protein